MEKHYFSSRDTFANIYEIQSYLRYISRFNPKIPSLVPDGIYGNETREAIKKFQEISNLNQSGEVDFETWTGIVELYDELRKENRLPHRISGFPYEIPYFKEGDEYDEIYLIQVMLRRLAKIYGNIEAPDLTGVYDKKTSEGIKKVGDIYGKESRGRLERELWNILTDTYNSFTANT